MGDGDATSTSSLSCTFLSNHDRRLYSPESSLELTSAPLETFTYQHILPVYRHFEHDDGRVPRVQLVASRNEYGHWNVKDYFHCLS